MIIDTTNNFTAPVRNISARVDLYEGSILADSYNKYYGLKEFTIDRVGESKFFGFGICQRFNVHLVDKDRLMHITTADNFRVFLSTGGNEISNFPNFYVTEVHRDENTNELSVTAYDAIYNASSRTVAELALSAPYTIGDFATACANLLSVEAVVLPVEAASFNDVYELGANFDGTESIREALTAIAEATQTIYFLDNENRLVFKRLDLEGNAVYEINKASYFTLDSGENRRLSAITHATELGDNVSDTMSFTGTTQYVRNNPFWDLREDIDILLVNALGAVGGLTIGQFSCSWRGNPLLEIGDKINLVAKDNTTITSFLLDDVITYDGSLSAATKWSYEDNEEETEANPASLGDALKQTHARVDKANRRIDLVASAAEGNTEAISALQLSTDGIIASVQEVKEATEAALEDMSNDVSTLTSKVSAAMTSEDVRIQIETELANGVDKVTTSTGFTFNEEGLTVAKSGSEMTTTITEDGMIVYRDQQPVLTANNVGVDATNLNATTYLIIGANSRLENYGTNRTGCFWIGG